MCKRIVNDCNRTKSSHDMGTTYSIEKDRKSACLKSPKPVRLPKVFSSKQVLHGAMVGEHSDISITTLLLTFHDSSPKAFFSQFQSWAYGLER